MRSTVIPVFLLAVLLQACSTGPTLPKERPSDLVVEVYEDGGMLPEGSVSYISADTAWYQLNFHGTTQRHPVSLTSQQLDELYGDLRRNKALQIKTRQEEVMDRGGTSLVIRFGGDRYSISNSGRNFVESEWQANFGKCIQAVHGLFDRAIKPSAVTFELNIADSTQSSKLESVNLSLHNNMIFTWTSLGKSPLPRRPLQRSLLPGEYLVDAKGKVNGFDISHSQSFFLKPTTKSITLTIYKGEFTFHENQKQQ